MADTFIKRRLYTVIAYVKRRVSSLPDKMLDFFICLNYFSSVVKIFTFLYLEIRTTHNFIIPQKQIFSII